MKNNQSVTLMLATLKEDFSKLAPYIYIKDGDIWLGDDAPLYDAGENLAALFSVFSNRLHEYAKLSCKTLTEVMTQELGMADEQRQNIDNLWDLFKEADYIREAVELADFDIIKYEPPNADEVYDLYRSWPRDEAVILEAIYLIDDIIGRKPYVFYMSVIDKIELEKIVRDYASPDYYIYEVLRQMGHHSAALMCIEGQKCWILHHTVNRKLFAAFLQAQKYNDLPIYQIPYEGANMIKEVSSEILSQRMIQELPTTENVLQQ